MPEKKFSLTSDCTNETVDVYEVSTEDAIRLDSNKVKEEYGVKAVCYRLSEDNSIKTIASSDVTQKYEDKIKEELDLP